GARYARDAELEHARDGDRAAHPVHRDPDRLRLGALEVTDQRTQRRHRPTALATRDRRERFTLLGRRPFVEDEADGPVALDHRAWRPQQDGKAEPVQPGVAVL